MCILALLYRRPKESLPRTWFINTRAFVSDFISQKQNQNIVNNLLTILSPKSRTHFPEQWVTKNFVISSLTVLPLLLPPIKGTKDFTPCCPSAFHAFNSNFRPMCMNSLFIIFGLNSKTDSSMAPSNRLNNLSTAQWTLQPLRSKNRPSYLSDVHY